MTMLIVETSKKTYLAADVQKDEGPTMTLKGAIEMDPQASPRDIAESYVEAQIRGELREVTQQRVNVEATSPAAEIGPLVELFGKLIPQAEKNAKDNATVKEIGKLIRGLTTGGKKGGSKSRARDDEGDADEDQDELPPARPLRAAR